MFLIVTLEALHRHFLWEIRQQANLKYLSYSIKCSLKQVPHGLGYYINLA